MYQIRRLSAKAGILAAALALLVTGCSDDNTAPAPPTTPAALPAADSATAGAVEKTVRTLFESVGPAYVSYDDSTLRSVSTDQCQLCGLWGQTAKKLGEQKVPVKLTDVEMVVRNVSDVRADTERAEAMAVVNSADITSLEAPRTDVSYRVKLVQQDSGWRVDSLQFGEQQ